MKEITDFLVHLTNSKKLNYPRLVMYQDESGHIEYDDNDAYSRILFEFNSIEHLLERIQYFELA